MNDENKKNCMYCKFGTHMLLNNEVICKYKGIVSGNYKCSKYKYDSTKVIKEEVKIYCIDCSYFKKDSTIEAPNNALGHCELFTQRLYDGSQKKSCSKFKCIIAE